MQSFLSKVSYHICSRHPGNLADVCIVLPNRRAGLFLKKLLPEITGKTTWSPDIFSIEDFCVHVSGYRLADPVGLLFDFYEIHKTIEGENQQPFDEFLQWGQLLLKDISEIDMNLVDAKALFNYLTEAKAIEKWNPGNPQLTEMMKNYLRFYRSLYDYYHALSKQAEIKKEAEKGHIFRKVAETIDDISLTLTWKKIYFAGFNALTVSEQKITSTLVNSGIAEILWDTDDYYLSDKNQEAGHFLRKELASTGKEHFKWIDEGFREVKKDITICGVPKNLGQARYAADVIQQWADVSKTENVQETLTNTALVLADENLLFHVLSSLHDQTPQFNVTMGFPVKFTSACQFFNQLFRLYENTVRFLSVDQNQPKGFYYVDMLKLLQHPYLNRTTENTTLVATIRQANRVFYQTNQIEALIKNMPEQPGAVYSKIFSNISPSPKEILNTFAFLINEFRTYFIMESPPGNDGNSLIEIEYLFHFSKIITRISGLITQYQSINQVKTLRKIFDYIVQTTRIPFEGEPLQGLQIMGLLETRSLDFDKVILLSVNEGILPSTSFGNSFIPLDIQRDFGLPVFKEKNAVFAYHFYRLLQKAKEVHLVYNTEPDELGGGEPSRFIYQLQQELPKYQAQHKIQEIILNLPVPNLSAPQEITIPKDDAIYQKLIEKAGTGFSPSAINLYVNCSLQFYLKEIAKITEADEVEETLETATLGNIVHKALEILYQPYVSQILTPDHISEMQKKADQAIAIAFADKYSGGDISFGWNKLKSEVIINFVRSFLAKEKEFLKKFAQTNKSITLLNLEKRFEASITLPDDKNIQVKLKGFIDRVDRAGDIIRIVDYKTGLVESKELTFSSWEAFVDSAAKGKAFQVLMYAWLFQQEHPELAPNYTSGVISMRKLSEGLMNFYIKSDHRGESGELIGENQLVQFELMLIEILNEIFNQEIPFSQTNDLNICKYCDFSKLCHRNN
ncbi:MAG: PD-(D/E)XK nuclease family protein [Bacteroidales bacterium]|nr:PD-(D/E)XK nuclease family protein [Bacteroidales bacterium]